MYIKDQKTYHLKDKAKEAVDGLEMRQRLIKGYEQRLNRLLGESEAIAAKPKTNKKDLKRLDQLIEEIANARKELDHARAEFAGRCKELGLTE